MNQRADVLIIGAGLAGLASAILLARSGFHVVVIEQDRLPKHRVCGEYVSREALPFLERLGFTPSQYDVKWIDSFELTTLRGRRFATPLDMGGFGLSRHRFDFALLRLALEAGVHVEQHCAAKTLTRTGDSYVVETSLGERWARVVLGCFGKRSGLDHALGRPHAKVRTPYVAVKRHYRGNFAPNVVGLHTIPGGYCGISAVEGDLVNVCYLTTALALEREGGLRVFDSDGLHRNVHLASHLRNLAPVFDKPLVISQVNFGAKAQTHADVLMLGDAAGLLHPLAGNGMAMALRSAALAVPEVEAFLRGISTHSALITRYASAWQNEVSRRRMVSRFLQRTFESDKLSERLCQLAHTSPRLARWIIENTHGRPF